MRKVRPQDRLGSGGLSHLRQRGGSGTSQGRRDSHGSGKMFGKQVFAGPRRDSGTWIGLRSPGPAAHTPNPTSILWTPLVILHLLDQALYLHSFRQERGDKKQDFLLSLLLLQNNQPKIVPIVKGHIVGKQEQKGKEDE